MTSTPRDKLNRERERIEAAAEEGDITREEADALLEWGTALDGEKVSHTYRDEEGAVKEYAPTSVKSYLAGLRLTAVEEIDIVEATAESFNAAMDRMHDSGRRGKSTLATYQSAARAFYRYHDDVGIEPTDIEVYSAGNNPMHDEQDMFDDAEINALRRGVGETQMVNRNRALLELLIFTGQRITALLTLRLRDVDVEEGYIYLNDEYNEAYGGMKGALTRGRKRPMFGARKYVRDYIDYRRADADQEDWLFIGNPSHPSTEPGEHLSPNAAWKVLRRVADRVDVDKPVNPHNFRHYFATVMYRDYDVDKDTIRMLLGHVEGSSTLEETYSHVFDEDYVRKAEEAMGYRETEEPQSFTPDVCPTCGELLEDHWRRCPSCDEVFGPGEDFEESVDKAKAKTESEAIESLDPEEIEAMQAILSVIDDPTALASKLAAVDDT